MIHSLFCDVLYEELLDFVDNLHKRPMVRVICNKGTYTFVIIYVLELYLFFYGAELHPVPA